jgi:hypothetical protein
VRESIADHEKPADLELSAGPLNIFQRATNSSPLIVFPAKDDMRPELESKLP